MFNRLPGILNLFCWKRIGPEGQGQDPDQDRERDQDQKQDQNQDQKQDQNQIDTIGNRYKSML